MDGYLIYTAGMTRRSFLQRFREHTRAYRAGVYTVFDAAYLQNGIRKIVWEGFWFKKTSAEKQREYQARIDEIDDATEILLRSYRVFVAPVTPAPRILERIEAAIMENLYRADGPAAVIPDRAMSLAPRWERETPLHIRSIGQVRLHGIPVEFQA